MFMKINKKKGLNMKVITMESSVFRSLTEQIAEIAAHVRAASGDKKAASPDRLLTTREAAQLLNVSTRTLQRMRSEQRIVYVVFAVNAATGSLKSTACLMSVPSTRTPRHRRS